MEKEEEEGINKERKEEENKRTDRTLAAFFLQI